MNHQLILSLLPLFLLIGCTKPKQMVVSNPAKTLVVLADNGKNHNAIIVSNNKGSQRLDKVREFVRLEDKNISVTQPKVMSKEKFKKSFKDVMNSLPKEAVTYRLYFKKDHMNLTESSKNLLLVISKKIVEAPCMVDIIGHTDTVGSEESNLEVSFEEANNIKAMLQEEILKVLTSQQSIVLTSKAYGENDLLIITPDEYKEERNRYVEVFIK